MDAHTLRRLFWSYFQEHGHAIIGSAPLIPEHDPSVLFTTAGMHPLVPFLLGEPHPAGTRLANVQSCLRTNDIAEVGDARHLTFFEMLGNWSLGDYWKAEALGLSYRFLTERLGLDPARLYVTCFAGDADAPRDDEAAAIWRALGIPPERISFLPKAGQLVGAGGPDRAVRAGLGDVLRHRSPTARPARPRRATRRASGRSGTMCSCSTTSRPTARYLPLPQHNVDTGHGPGAAAGDRAGRALGLRDRAVRADRRGNPRAGDAARSRSRCASSPTISARRCSSWPRACGPATSISPTSRGA